MNRSDFLRAIRANFDPILLPLGFSTEDSKHCVYWRKASDDVFHFVCPSKLRSGDRYDITVYPSSPTIYVDFAERFPDWIPFTNGNAGYLSPEEGVGSYQKLYFCGNADAFATSFRRDVVRALMDFAIPYLDKVQSMEDIIPTIKQGGMMGAALSHLGRFSEAKPFIEGEILRLSSLPRDKDGLIERSLAFQRSLMT